MRLITQLAGSPIAEPGCVATIGNFDGVHLGHRGVIDMLAGAGRRLGLPAAVILFEPQPREYFQPVEAPPRLTRLREKLHWLAELPVDLAAVLRFNRSVAEMSAERFVRDILVDALKVRHLVVGDDFRFGHDRAGDFALLRRMGQAHGFAVVETPSIQVDGQRVSSTSVRAALTAGDLDLAARLCGRAYSICGRVVHGAKRGRTLGFPTANVRMQRKSSPLQGVFAVTMHGIAAEPRAGVANVGLRPTVDGGLSVLLETFLFDFDGDLYGRRVSVTFHHKLRDERRFAGIEELRQQIQLDVAAARAFFAGAPPHCQTRP